MEDGGGAVLTWCIQVNRQTVFGDHLQVPVFGGPAEVNVVGAVTLYQVCLPTLWTWKHSLQFAYFKVPHLPALRSSLF